MGRSPRGASGKCNTMLSFSAKFMLQGCFTTLKPKFAPYVYCIALHCIELDGCMLTVHIRMIGNMHQLCTHVLACIFFALLTLYAHGVWDKALQCQRCTAGCKPSTGIQPFVLKRQHCLWGMYRWRCQEAQVRIEGPALAFGDLRLDCSECCL